MLLRTKSSRHAAREADVTLCLGNIKTNKCSPSPEKAFNARRAKHCSAKWHMLKNSLCLHFDNSSKSCFLLLSVEGLVFFGMWFMNKLQFYMSMIKKGTNVRTSILHQSAKINTQVCFTFTAGAGV